ncbi:MAG: hypothetical protein ACLRZG_10680 [Streptococcus sp.]
MKLIEPTISYNVLYKPTQNSPSNMIVTKISWIAVNAGGGTTSGTP